MEKIKKNLSARNERSEAAPGRKGLFPHCNVAKKIRDQRVAGLASVSIYSLENRNGSKETQVSLQEKKP